MVIRTAWMINANAKGNKGRRAVNHERRRLESETRLLKDARVNVTKNPEKVRILCDEYIRDSVEVAGLSGGDGTVQKFLTEYFKQLYRKFGKGNTPIEFAQMMNAMAIDPESRLLIPSVYHRKKGTLNFYADTTWMRASIDTIVENLHNAENNHGEMGQKLFRRMYLPILMLYDKENPNDLDHIQLMGLYADGLVYNFFEQYYLPQKKGKDSSMLTAAEVIARAAASVTLDKLMPRDSALGKMMTDRYIDRIISDVRGEVVADAEVVIPAGGTRKAMAIGTVNASLYGLKPFYRMPGTPEEFRRLGLYFEPLERESHGELNPRDHYMQMLVGDTAPMNIIRAIPQILAGKPTNIPGMADLCTKKIELSQEQDLRYIGDGGEMKDGRRVAIEIAYLQPFILLDYAPME